MTERYSVCHKPHKLSSVCKGSSEKTPFKMFSKVLFILCAVLASTHASVLLARPVISTGVSASSRTQDAIGNYAFNYDIVDAVGATNSRAEVGDAAGNKKGSYSLSDIDGRARRVDYVADGTGFRASVKTNEPGTALSAPAAAEIISPYAAPQAPVVAKAAPLATIAAAPVLAGAPIAPIAAAPLLSAIPQVSAYSSIIGHGATIGVPVGLGLGLRSGIAKSILL